jgi:phospholipase C
MKTYITVFSFLVLAAAAGCAGQADGGDEPLAEIPVRETVLPDGTRQTDWDAESADDETKSTHLWIVNRAIDLLRTRTDLAQANSAVALLTSSDCVSRWHQGLVDADFKAAYNGGRWDVEVGGSSASLILAGATWEAHFYDPDTGKNYKGNTSPVGYGEALNHLGQARTKLAAGDRFNGCYELGLSLHFMTDITQPMHASNYTAKDWPFKLHSNVESYAVGQQSRWAIHSWAGPTAGDASAQLLASAHTSKSLWPILKSAISASYGARCGNFDSYWTDHTDCWQGDASVDAQLASELSFAQTATASYLYALALR